ncbi:FtsX-like permease family protein [Actinokineospora auranticolor]|uniref:FtsX-like permease family protein n=1 Tax=Actinokineospora auranticolor TaxID=155976 RepID=A0A2S6GDC6_9PSEU|nr:FtsX-like permease family protein [Actinokineospora auranticolor]PPK63248.1 FtsX-like permease family protein [Actinokineospora auranticolor]
MRDLRLGWRMAVAAGSRSWLRLALGAVAGLVAALLLASAVAAYSAINTAEERDEARRPINSDNGNSSLLMAERRSSYRGEDVTVLPVVAPPGSPVPPGLAAWPASGTIAVSPAMASALTDPVLRAEFPQPVAAVVGPEGITGPGELLVYTVVDPFPGDEQSLRPVVGFGTDPPPGVTTIHLGGQKDWTDLLTPSRILILLALLYILLPLAVVIATATRLSAATRDRKLASLRVIGFSARRCQVINAVETVVATGIGAVLGLVLFALVRGVRDQWWIGPVGAYSNDLTLGVAPVLAVAVGVPLYAVLVSAIAIGSAVRDPFRPVRRAPVRPSALRLVPLGLGVAGLVTGLVLGPVDPSIGEEAAWLLLPTAGGAVLTLVGLLTSLPLLLRRFGDRMARTGSLPVRLGGAALRRDSVAGTRVLAGVLAGLCASGAGMVLSAATSTDGAVPQSHIGEVIKMSISQPLSPAVLGELAAIDGVSGVARSANVNGTTLIADCASLRALYTGAESCVDGKRYVLPGSGGAGVELPLVNRTPNSRDFLTDVVTPAALDPAEVPQLTSTVVIDGGVPTADRIRAVLGALAPAADAAGPIIVRQAMDTATLGPVVTALAITTLSLGAIALAITTTDDVLRRRREQSRLRVVGLDPGTLRGTALVRVWTPTLTGGLLTTVVATAISAALLRALGKPLTPALTTVAPLLVATVLLCALLAVPVATSAVPPLTARALRRE